MSATFDLLVLKRQARGRLVEWRTESVASALKHEALIVKHENHDKGTR